MRPIQRMLTLAHFRDNAEAITRTIGINAFFAIPLPTPFGTERFHSWDVRLIVESPPAVASSYPAALTVIYEQSFYRIQANVKGGDHKPLNPVLVRELPLVLEKGVPRLSDSGIRKINRTLDDIFPRRKSMVLDIPDNGSHMLGKPRFPELIFTRWNGSQLELIGMPSEYMESGDHTHSIRSCEGRVVGDPRHIPPPGSLPSIFDLGALFQVPNSNPMHIFYVPIDLDFLAEELREGRLPDRAKIEAMVRLAMENEVVGIKVTGSRDKETEPKIILQPIVHP